MKKRSVTVAYNIVPSVSSPETHHASFASLMTNTNSGVIKTNGVIKFVGLQR